MKYDTLLLIGLESYAEGTYPYGKIASSINSKLRDSKGDVIYPQQSLIINGSVTDIVTLDGRKRLAVNRSGVCHFKIDDALWPSTLTTNKPVRLAMGMCIRFTERPSAESFTVCVHTNGRWSKIDYDYKPNVDYYIELLWYGPRQSSKSGAFYINGKRIDGVLGTGGGSKGQECFIGVNFTSPNNVVNEGIAYISDLYISQTSSAEASPLLGPVTIDSIDCVVQQYKDASVSNVSNATGSDIENCLNTNKKTTDLLNPSVVISKSGGFVHLGFKPETLDGNYVGACTVAHCYSEEPSGNNLKVSVNLNGGGGYPVNLEPGSPDGLISSSYSTGKLVNDTLTDAEIKAGFFVSIKSEQG
ncbi:hypothetical protein ABN214_15655 [Proteus terrae]|uniref:hypothetical protein n=1 Tax=Proteus terrae TaxID=1574161 RepID=UPI0032DB814C